MNGNFKNNSESIPPKKSLGQNFLTSTAAVAHMLEAADIQKGEQVLEIGPGKGVLTKRLVEEGARVTAIEKDRRLISYLRELFKESIQKGNIRLVEGDALEHDLRQLYKKSGEYKLVANIPYYITGQLLRKFLSTPVRPARMVLLVQREVANRILAKDGKESLLSLSVKAYGSPRIISVVKAGSFFPVPSVDSAILMIGSISAGLFSQVPEDDYFRMLHAAFAQKRKMLRKNLEALYDGTSIERAFVQCNLPPTIRAEDVPAEKWVTLCKELVNK